MQMRIMSRLRLQKNTLLIVYSNASIYLYLCIILWEINYSYLQCTIYLNLQTTYSYFNLSFHSALVPKLFNKNNVREMRLVKNPLHCPKSVGNTKSNLKHKSFL